VDASLAATASMSAHDTIPGHVFSSSLFASSIIPYPLADPRFGNAVFSLTIVGVSSSKIEASQPYT